MKIRNQINNAGNAPESADSQSVKILRFLTPLNKSLFIFVRHLITFNQPYL